MQIEISPCQQNILCCAFSPNNQYLALLKPQLLSIYLADQFPLSEPISTYQVAEKASTLKFSNDSELILVHSKSSLVEIFKINEQWKSKIEDTQLNIIDALFSPSNTEVLTFSDFQIKLSIYSLVDKSTLIIKGPKYPDKGYSFTKDGKFMALLEKRETKDALSIYSCAKWKLLNVILLETNDAFDLLWSYDNTVILVWDNLLEYKFFVYCPVQGLLAKLKPYDYALGIKSVKMSPNALFVSIGSYDEKVRLINSLT